MSEYNEPWKPEHSLEGTVLDVNGRYVCSVSEVFPCNEEEIIQRDRIIACVNACAGIPTAELLDVDPKHTQFPCGLVELSLKTL